MKTNIFRVPTLKYKQKRIGEIPNKIKKNKPKRKLSKETEITKDTQTSTCKECNFKDLYN